MRTLSRAAGPAVIFWIGVVLVASGLPTLPSHGQSAADVVIASPGRDVSSAPPGHDAGMIADVRASWEEAVNTLDLHGLLRLYAPGAVLFPADAPVRLGSRAIGNWHGRWSAKAEVHYAIDVTALQVDGSRALEEWVADVTITPSAGDGIGIAGDPLQFRQRGVRVYRKDDEGNWRIDRETWSADHPTAAPFLSLAEVSG
jgi:ketosteroid isomerase-like protein